MLATILIDVYPKGQDFALQVANAIDTITNPNDGEGFASTGVYSFWNFPTRETMYIGYTNDFHRRFMEHNGMGDYDPKFSKWRHIEKHFETEDFLGFSMFVQSPMDQPLVGANRGLWLDDATADVLEAIEGLEGEARARKVEGCLIRAHTVVTGRRPLWNDAEAGRAGSEMARKDHFELVLNMTGLPSVLTSRYTIQELAKDPHACGLESTLHAARMNCINDAIMTGNGNITLDDLFRELQTLDATRAEQYRKVDYPKIPIPFAWTVVNPK